MGTGVFRPSVGQAEVRSHQRVCPSSGGAADDLRLPALPASKATKPRLKPTRFVRLYVRPVGNAVGVVLLTVGTERADYFVTEMPAESGRGIRVEKIGITYQAAVYHAHIDGDRKACDCKSQVFRSHLP